MNHDVLLAAVGGVIGAVFGGGAALFGAWLQARATNRATDMGLERDERHERGDYETALLASATNMSSSIREFADSVLEAHRRCEQQREEDRELFRQEVESTRMEMGDIRSALRRESRARQAAEAQRDEVEAALRRCRDQLKSGGQLLPPASP